MKIKCSERTPEEGLIKNSYFKLPERPSKDGYRFGTEFGAEDIAYGGGQQRVELRAQAEEVTEGEDKHLFGMSVQPLAYLHENALLGEHRRSDRGGASLQARRH